MDNRKKTLLSFILGVAAVFTAACGFSKQSSFQMSFLPPAPRAAESAEEAPVEINFCPSIANHSRVGKPPVHFVDQGRPCALVEVEPHERLAREFL